MFTTEYLEMFPYSTTNCHLIVCCLDILQQCVENTINNLNPNKVCGPDNIHLRVIMELCDVLIKPLTFIFSQLDMKEYTTPVYF